MSSTVDVNVLVHASHARDPLEGPANALLSQLIDGPGLLHLFWPVLLGAVRIVTHPGILSKPLSLATALDNVDAIVAQPNVRVHGDTDGAWPIIRATQLEIGATGNDVPDAHIVALMRQHGVPVIYTQDRGFRRFDGIEVRSIV